MSGYYVLHITDLSDKDNHKYYRGYPSNWDEGEDKVNSYAMEHGYSLAMGAKVVDYVSWQMAKDGKVTAGATLERINR